MSTNASIALFDQAKQTVTTIHLSCDGYPSHAGKILLNHYKTEKRVKSLLKLGDLFSVYPKIPSKLPDLKTFWATAKKNPDRDRLPFGTDRCFRYIKSTKLDISIDPSSFSKRSSVRMISP